MTNWLPEEEAARPREEFAAEVARLNLGGGFAYALPKNKGEPLLFKGNDFIDTDIIAAQA